MTPVLTADEVAAYLAEVFPQAASLFQIDDISPLTAIVSMEIGEAHLRPGGTVSGPTMFLLADCAFYVAVLGMIGRRALAVTSNLNINFLRKPSVAPMRAEARILKPGRLLMTGDVTLYSQDEPRPVAHATVTYAIPQDAAPKQG